MPPTIGVHRSVSDLFPPAALGDVLGDIPWRVAPVDDVGLTACDAVVTFAHDPAFFDAGVDWVHCVLAGVDDFPLGAYVDRGVTLTNSTGIHGDAVGETVAGYMLTFARRLHAHRDRQHERTWSYPAWDVPFTLTGERVCVVGLGTLGRGVATRADALGMDVVGVKRTPTPVDGVGEVHPPRDLHRAVADARFVVLTVPLTDDTRGMVGRAELAAMPDDAYLVNVARGPVVDQDALVEALQSGGLAGAALDVFEAEPLPEDSPLWGMDEVVVTPHAAAATRRYRDRVATLVRENVHRFEAGDPPANEVV